VERAAAAASGGSRRGGEVLVDLQQDSVKSSVLEELM
jgi:hypothetical protein